LGGFAQFSSFTKESDAEAALAGEMK